MSHKSISIELLTVLELTKKLKLSKSSIYNFINAGYLPKPIKLGKNSRFNLEQIDRIIRLKSSGKSDDELKQYVQSINVSGS